VHDRVPQVANKRAKIDKLKAENESVERDVTRFNEREALRATAAEMKTKVPWLVFGQAKTRWADAKTELAELKKNIIAEEGKLKHLKTPMVRAKDELDGAVAKHKKCAAARKALVAKQHVLIETMESEVIEHEAIAERLTRAREAAQNRERRIREREKKLRDAEAARARAPSVPEDRDDELKALRAKRVEMNSELRAVEEEHEELTRKMQQPQHTVEHASKRLAVLNSVRGQRLAKAREVSKRQRLGEFDEYVRENANYFVKPVLGPILTLMECADQTHRNMLSQSIANNVFGAYVTQTKADYDKVSATARAMRCDVFLVEKSVWSEPDVSHLRELGVTHRLDQTFDAPAVIKTVLCNVSSLHKAYALKSMPGAQVERIVKTTEVRRAFTPDTAYASSTSRYDASAVAITVRDLRVSNTFQGGVDERERGELEKRVEGARREVAALAKTKGVIQERRKRLETEIERVAARQKNLAAVASSVREEIRRLDGAVASARGYLERDSRATDVDKIERETKRDASASLKKRVKTALEAAAVTAEAAEKTHELTTRALRCKELHVQYEYFKDEWNTASETNNRLRDELRPSEERLRTLKQAARDLRVPAMEATNGRDPGKDAALEAKFAQWDNDLAILEESVRMIEDEADAIMCPNEAVLEDYKARQRQVETIEAGLVDQERSLEGSAAEIDALRAVWTPKLRRLVETINENFKRNFAAIGCAGEVRLREDPRGDRLDLWKLEIWVKFRAATDMHILDAHRQSGGERSVSTMLYLISLQELTRAPFRVVDEINQGMDPVNERKIFKRMTDAASKDSTPQTFLLTPKLLNNLQYTEDCTVLCIFNGPWIAEVAKKWRALQEALQPVPPPDTPP